MLSKSIIFQNQTTTSHQTSHLSNSTKYSKIVQLIYIIIQTLSILNHKHFQQLIHLKTNTKYSELTISINILLYSSKETILQAKF